MFPRPTHTHRHIYTETHIHAAGSSCWIWKTNCGNDIGSACHLHPRSRPLHSHLVNKMCTLSARFLLLFPVYLLIWQPVTAQCHVAHVFFRCGMTKRRGRLIQNTNIGIGKRRRLLWRGRFFNLSSSSVFSHCKCMQFHKWIDRSVQNPFTSCITAFTPSHESAAVRRTRVLLTTDVITDHGREKRGAQSELILLQ